MMLLFIVILGVLVLINIRSELKSRRLLQRFWSRSCTGQQWKRCFPNASKDSIRDFLGLFVDAFLFSSDKRFKFGPDDKIMEVYKSLYPYSWSADAMELGIFGMNIEDKYGIDIKRKFTPDITLGQIFDLTRNHKVIFRTFLSS